jgi:hypothetical protein
MDYNCVNALTAWWIIVSECNYVWLRIVIKELTIRMVSSVSNVYNWGRTDQVNPQHCTILSSSLCVGFPSSLFPSGFPNKILIKIDFMQSAGNTKRKRTRIVTLCEHFLGCLKWLPCRYESNKYFNILSVFSIDWTEKLKMFIYLHNLLWSKLSTSIFQSWLILAVHAKHVCLTVPKKSLFWHLVLKFLNADFHFPNKGEVQGAIQQSLTDCYLQIAWKAH